MLPNQLFHLLAGLTVASLTSSAVAIAAVSNSPAQQHQLQVAFACPSVDDDNSNNLPAVVWLADPAGGSGRWHAEPRLTGCPSSSAQMLEFCRLAYPHIADIVNVAPASEAVTIPSWCPVDSAEPAADCAPRTVTPQLCLTTGFKSDALLLPPGCRFDHRAADNPRDPTECRTVSEWRRVAEGRCANGGGQVLRTHSLLLPCSGAGEFAGVEFVCCPKDDEPTELPSVNTAEDRDKKILQRYLALPTRPSISESERYAKASGSLARINQAEEARLESQMSSEENRVLDKDSDASRLVSDILTHYRRAFKSLERQESAERLQLDSVHEDRLSGGVRASLLHMRQLLSKAVDASKQSEAVGYLQELGRMTAAEAARVANQAVAMATGGRLTAQRLDSTKHRLAELREQLTEARQLLGEAPDADKYITKPLDGLRRAEAAADRLTPSSEASPDESALAARFAEILRRHAARDQQRLKASVVPHQQHHQQHQQHQQLMMPDDRLALMPHPSHPLSDNPTASHGHSGVPSSSSAALSGVLGGLAALLLIGLVAMAIVRGFGGRHSCLRRWSIGQRGFGGGSGGPGGHGGGYKLTLVDEQPSQVTGGGGFQQPQNCHLANLQANGYENPTYKFLEG